MLINLYNSFLDLVVALATAAVIVIIVVVLLIALEVIFSLFPGPGYRKTKSQKIENPPYIPSYKTIPNTLYHGTKSLQSARSIIQDGWLIGLASEIWMTSDFGTAKSYGDYIVEIDVAPNTGVFHKWFNVFTASIPYARNDTFYQIHGVTPIRILNSHTGSQMYP